jgi:hypothetical protein
VADADSVDIYAPFTVFVGATPATIDSTGNFARSVSGTSFSSPFAAGVAALVWAAKPSLSQNEVWTILRETAHVGGVGGTGNLLRVNAWAAVQRALGGNVPPFVRIDRPTAGQVLTWRLNASLGATIYDLDDGAPVVTWTSGRDGTLGTGPSLNVTTLSVGSHTLTAQATAGGRSATSTVNVTVQNNAPTVTIREPAAGASFCTSDNIRFVADVADLNNNASFPFPPGGIAWSSTPARLVGTGATVTQTFPAAGSYTARVRATDEQGEYAEATVPFTVAVCTNTAPVAMISTPPDMAGTGPDLYATPGTSDSNGYYLMITLVGSGTDAEDGTLTGASLVWTTNRGDVQPGGVTSGAQVLGTGASLPVKLYTTCTFPYGGTVDHTITLTVTDSNSNARSVSRIIRVETLC